MSDYSFEDIKPKPLSPYLGKTNVFYRYWLYGDDDWYMACREEPSYDPWDELGYYIDVPAFSIHKPASYDDIVGDAGLCKAGKVYWVYDNHGDEWCEAEYCGALSWIRRDVGSGLYSGNSIRPKWIVLTPKSPPVFDEPTLKEIVNLMDVVHA